MTINIEYETTIKITPDIPEEDIIRSVIEEAVNFEKCPYETEVNIILTDSASIREINKEYRDIDAPTDVLSFPMVSYDAPADFGIIEDSNAEDFFEPDTGELILGDIIISVERVMEQAAEYGHSVKRELAFLVAHSMLHLFGYDHITEEDAGIMEERQEKILMNIGIPR